MNSRRVATRLERGVPVVVLSGEIDHEVVPRVQEAAEAVSGAGEWVLDLTSVTYLDSAGLRLLLDLDLAARARGGLMRVAPPGEGMALRALQVSGVDRRLAR
jgi:anti-sigma B factor antagonist